MATSGVAKPEEDVKSDTLLALIDLLKDLTRDEKRRVSGVRSEHCRPAFSAEPLSPGKQVLTGLSPDPRTP